MKLLKNRKFRRIFISAFTILALLSLSIIGASAAEIETIAADNGTYASSIVQLLNTMMSVLGSCITNLMRALQIGFLQLLFVNGSAASGVSAIGVFLFVMFGLSLALSLGYFVLRILHRRS